MSLNDEMPMRICLNFVLGAKSILTDSLYRHHELREELGRRTESEDAKGEQYVYDMLAHELLLSQLREGGVNASVFSEEGTEGWIHVGAGSDYLIVVDPFDQSTTTARTFRMAAVAICVMDGTGIFKACAVGDLNTHLIYLADESGAYLSIGGPRMGLCREELKREPIHPSSVEHVSDAFIVLPGAKRKRREFVRKSTVTANAGYWLNVDGVLNICRVAAGHIDAYLDPSMGQPIYEVVCAELVRKAGGVVTDSLGHEFNLRYLVETLKVDSEYRYPIVVSSTVSLQRELLALLEADREAGLLAPVSAHPKSRSQ